MPGPEHMPECQAECQDVRVLSMNVRIHVYYNYIYIHNYYIYIYIYVHTYISMPYIYIYIHMYIYISKWYVRNYVRIVCQGGDHSKQSNFICFWLGTWASTWRAVVNALSVRTNLWLDAQNQNLYKYKCPWPCFTRFFWGIWMVASLCEVQFFSMKTFIPGNGSKTWGLHPNHVPRHPLKSMAFEMERLNATLGNLRTAREPWLGLKIAWQLQQSFSRLIDHPFWAKPLQT